MVAGAGGMLVAAQEIARLESEISRRRAVRQARREAMRERLTRHEDYEHYEHEDHEQGPQRVDFVCFHMCAHCGYLARDAEGVCPACKEGTWLDLADHVVADTVREDEIRARLEIPLWLKVGYAAALGATATALYVVFAMLFLYDLAGFVVLLASLVTVAVAGVVYALTIRQVAVLLARTRETKPYRWHLPMPLSDAAAPVRTREGVATLTGEPLVAPFSRRGCIAYQACVLFDTPEDARPPEWVIQESYGVDFEVDGDAMDGVHVLVHTPLEEIPLQRAEADGLDLARR